MSVGQRAYRILVLSGGGFRGVFSARVLAHIEKTSQKQVRDLFDLIVGTSTGALIGAGLATGKSAHEIETTYVEIGPSIFALGPNWLRKIEAEKTIILARRLFLSEPYSQARLKAAIRSVLGKQVAKQSISGLSKFVAVAVSYTHSEVRLFGPEDLGGHHDISVEKAILASAAAPTFFPPMLHQKELFVDGGLVANSPELIGLRIAMLAGIDLKDIRLLSIGTGSPDQSLGAQGVQTRNVFQWLLSRRGLVQLTMGAQEHFAATLADCLLGNNYARIDRVPALAQASLVGEMDNVAEGVADTLRLMADEAWGDFQKHHVIARFTRQ